MPEPRTIELSNPAQLPGILGRAWACCDKDTAVANFYRCYGRWPERVFHWQNGLGTDQWWFQIW